MKKRPPPLLIKLLPGPYKNHGRLLLASIAKWRRVPDNIRKWYRRRQQRPAAKEPRRVEPIEQVLQNAHRQLLDLQRRQFALEAFDAEWGRVTRGKEWIMWDQAMFEMVVASDAMNVIDLCSWALGTADVGPGLLGRIKDVYLREFPAQRRWGTQAGDAYLARLQDDGFAAARARLFPSAQGRSLTHRDADDLIANFSKHVQPLVDDRNKNRAHAYEYRDHGTAKVLDLAEVRALYAYARAVLNDLCLVALGSSWSENDLNSNSVANTARDLTDVIFLPRWFRDETQHREIDRDELYDALHADPRPGPFNGREKLERLAGREDRAARTGQT